MILQQYLPSSRDTWTWRLAQPEHVIPIVALADTQFGNEVDDIFTRDPRRMAGHVHVAITQQTYDHSQQQIIVAENSDGHVIAWSWIKRGIYMPYAPEECCEAEFAHVDLNLPSIARIRVLAQMIIQWSIWCQIQQIPVLISSTIRADQAGFLRLHEQAGFTIRGSIAYTRTDQPGTTE
jgi:hypothetical protein